MTLEEFMAKTQEVLTNLGDQAIVSTLLTELNEGYTKVTAETSEMKTTSEKLVSDNEKLRQANMNLFLKVGETKAPETKKEEEEKGPTYEDLFDADGNLK